MAPLMKNSPAIRAERRFFLIMAIALAGTVVFGFGLDLQRISWNIKDMPVQVHIHAALFFGWTILYVAQNWLVDRGAMPAHRQLGLLMAGLSPAMLVVGIATTVLAIRMHRVPPFFQPGLFLALDLQLVGFAMLTAWALLLRARSDWHKRLMLCGTILVISPALGRIVPVPLLGPFGTWAVFAATMLYLVTAMLFDFQVRGRVHTAYWWGAGVLTGVQLLLGPVGASAPVARIVERISA